MEKKTRNIRRNCQAVDEYAGLDQRPVSRGGFYFDLGGTEEIDEFSDWGTVLVTRP